MKDKLIYFHYEKESQVEIHLGDKHIGMIYGVKQVERTQRGNLPCTVFYDKDSIMIAKLWNAKERNEQ